MVTRGVKNSKVQYGRLIYHKGRLKPIVVGSSAVPHKGTLLAVELSIIRSSFSPVVTYGGRSFCLGWDDIIILAKQAGLFDKALEVSNE